MSVDLIALAQLGGFATLGIVMTLAANKVFAAWRSGDLVARAVWEKSEERGTLLATQLERNTDALEANTATMATLAASQERQTRAMEAQAEALRVLAEKVKA